MTQMTDRRMRRSPDRAGGEKAWWRMPAILLSLAGVVVIATVMVWLGDSGGRGKTPNDEVGNASSRSDEAVRVVVGARAFLRASQMKEALRLMRSYIALNPEDSTVRVLLAETLLVRGRPEQAGQVVRRLLEVAPDSSEGLWLKGRILRRKSQEGWRDYFRRAAENPDAPAKVLASYGMLKFLDRDDEQARKFLTAAHEKGMDGPQILAALGEIAARAKKYDEAQKWLGEAVRKDEQDAGLWGLLANVQRRGGKYEAAALTLTRALRKIRRWKDRPVLLFELGEIRVLQRRRKEAATAYAQASDSRADWTIAALRAAQSYYFARSYALAMKYADRAFQLDPSDEEVKTWRTKIEDARFGPSSTPSDMPAAP